MQLAATAVQGGSRAKGRVTRETVGTTTIFRIEGSLSSNLLPSLDSDVCSAIFSGTHVVLDLSETAYLGPDGLGTLVQLFSVAHDWRREFWLTGLRPFHMRVIYASQLRSHFRIAPKVTDALRRIKPDPMPLRIMPDKDGAFCRIGGKMVPIEVHEVRDLYHQMRILLNYSAQENRNAMLTRDADRQQ
jgi:anti-anti-sigma factor